MGTEEDTPEDNGPEVEVLYCWKDASRPCGSDCMAFIVPKEHKTHCSVLATNKGILYNLKLIARSKEP